MIFKEFLDAPQLEPVFLMAPVSAGQKSAAPAREKSAKTLLKPAAGRSGPPL